MTEPELASSLSFDVLRRAIERKDADLLASLYTEDAELTVDLEAELDLRGFFQLAPIRPGPSGIKAKVKVKSDADEAMLEELARLATQTSPTYDSISNPVPIESSVERVA